MPIGIKFSNFAFSTLAVGCNTTATSLALATGTGAKFPTLAAGEYFYATLENASLNREVVKVTARVTDTITVVRGQDNTTARSWNAGDSIALRLNAGALDDFKAEVVDATNLIRTSNNTFTGTNVFNTAPTFGTDLAISGGGTGATTAATAFDNLKQAATDAYAGAVELATAAEAQAGTDNTRAVTPLVLQQSKIVLKQTITTNGASVYDIASIPSWVTRVTLLLLTVSTVSGSSNIILRVGSDGVVQTTGYDSAIMYNSTSGFYATSTVGILLTTPSVYDYRYTLSGSVTLTRAPQTNRWYIAGTTKTSFYALPGAVYGVKSDLTAPLDVIRLTTLDAASNFDGGTLDVLME